VFANPEQRSETPDERLREIAAVLARGILRLREAGGFLAICDPENSSNSGPDRLELSGKTRLSVTSGLRFENSQRRRTA